MSIYSILFMNSLYAMKVDMIGSIHIDVSELVVNDLSCLTGGSNWWRTWCGLRMTDRPMWSADWKRSDNDGVCVGRNPYLTYLLIIACRRLHLDALRNPNKVGLALCCNCETMVERIPSHIACPTRPCSLIVFNTYIDLAAIPPTACTSEQKLNTWLIL